MERVTISPTLQRAPLRASPPAASLPRFLPRSPEPDPEPCLVRGTIGPSI
jgi:hypothetical protein